MKPSPHIPITARPKCKFPMRMSANRPSLKEEHERTAENGKLTEFTRRYIQQMDQHCCSLHGFQNRVYIRKTTSCYNRYFGFRWRSGAAGVKPSPAVVEIETCLMIQGLHVDTICMFGRSWCFWKIPAPVHISIGTVIRRIL